MTLTSHRASLSALAGELPTQSPSPLEGEGRGGGFREAQLTNADGRIADLTGGGIEPGSYQVVFDLGPYFGDRPHLFNKVSFEIVVTEARLYHVPLLISPYSCSSYRGS